MYVDLIEYELADGIDFLQLKEIAESVKKAWMDKQQGFIGWEIFEFEGQMFDIVRWEDQTSAKKAQENMKDIEKDHPWFSCYKYETIKSKKGIKIYP